MTFEDFKSQINKVIHSMLGHFRLTESAGRDFGLMFIFLNFHEYAISQFHKHRLNLCGLFPKTPNRNL